MISTLRTLEQERAKKAWECVVYCLIFKKDDEKWQSKYNSLVRKVSSCILTNGLGQTLAFLKAKGEGKPDSEHEVLYQHIAGWITACLHINGDLLEWIITHANSQQYRRITMEVLSFLQWLKRFAEAQLPKGEEE